MKKHFLLLMMALFSLTGWAEDLTGNEGVIVAVGDLEYGATEHAANAIRVTLDGGEIGTQYWENGGYYKKSGDTYTATTLAALNVGDECYLKINFKGVYSGYAYGSFSITQATLSVEIKTDAYFTMPYNSTYANKPAVAAEDVTVKLRNTTVAVADYVNINATTLAAYTWAGNNNLNAGSYAITFAGVTPKDATNYKVVFADRNMDITAIEISEANNFAAAIKENTYPAGGFTYSAAPQKPTYLVTWDDDNSASTAAKSLVEGTDFEVKYTVSASFITADVQPTATTFGQGTYFLYDTDNGWYEQATTFDETKATSNKYCVKGGSYTHYLLVNSTIDANTYNAYVCGKGNYTGKMAKGTFVINKADLRVMAIAQTKVYNGEAFNLGTAQFNIAGLVGDDQGKTVNGLVATTTATDLTNVVLDTDGKTVKGVQVTVNSDAATIGDGNNAPLLSKNYTVTALPSTWTINQRPVTLTVANINMTKGATAFPCLGEGTYPAIDKTEVAAQGTTAAPVVPITVQEGYVAGGTTAAPTYTTAGDEGAISPDDKSNLSDAYNLEYADDPATGTAGQPGYVAAEPLFEVTTANIKIQDYTNAIKAVPAGSEWAGIKNYVVTINKGTLKVSGAAFNVMPVVNNQIEYGEDYTFGVYGYTNEGAEATIDASKAQFEIEKINEDGTKTAVNGKPTERGNYRVTIKEGTVTGTGNFANSTPTRVPGAFSIIKKTLDLNAFVQTVHKGDPITIIGEKLVFDTNKQFKEGKAPKSGEEVELTYTLTENKVAVDDNDKITGFATGVTSGVGIIEVALAEDNEVNANYVIAATCVKGDLIISNKYDLVLGGDETADKIAAADENGSEEVSVTFVKGAVTMNEKEWYAMVLPFETTPAEIVSELGTYVVVNTIKSSTMDDAGVVDVNFSLEMDKVEAGVPFLIKPAKDIDLGARVLYNAATAAEKNATLTGHVAKDQDVPADYATKVGSPAAGTKLTADEAIKYNATLTGAVAAGDETEDAIAKFEGKQIFSVIEPQPTDFAIFAGTYANDESVKWGLDVDGTTADADAKYRWLAHKEYKGDNNWKNPKTNAHTLAPMEAYLILDAAATKARVYVEDIENGVTAIKSLSVDDVKGLNVEGMYTIGGMKLQGAPTQKGVYIKDGKKVIIK